MSRLTLLDQAGPDKRKFADMRMVSFDQALATVKDLAKPLGLEQIPFEEAAGRVLAQDLLARSSAPAYDVSAMDGYGVRDVDLATVPAALEVVAESFAGSVPMTAFDQAGCVRIFTGAPVPPGIDRVVIQENVEREGMIAHFIDAPMGKRNIRQAGSDFKADDCLLPKGTKLHWRAMTTAAAADRALLDVYKAPKLIILATGDELSPPGTAYQTPGHIPESVSYGIAALAVDKGADLLRSESLPDDPEALSRAAQRALEDADVIVVTGGASVGEKDYARSMFEIRESDYVFPKVAIKPGKPVWMATRSGKVILGLPGNPSAALVTARLFLAPLLAGLMGQDAMAACQFMDVLCRDGLPEIGGRETFSPAYLENGKAVLFTRQDSSLQSSLANAKILIRRPAYSPSLPPGTPVKVVEF